VPFFDSDVLGAMGLSLVPFTNEQDAADFQEEYGGAGSPSAM